MVEKKKNLTNSNEETFEGQLVASANQTTNNHSQISKEKNMETLENTSASQNTSSNEEQQTVNSASSKRVRKPSTSEKQKRNAKYFGKLRNVKSLESKYDNLSTIISRGKEVVTRIVEGEKTLVTVNLTSAQLDKRKAQREEVGFQLIVARNDLKVAEYGVKNTTRREKHSIRVSKKNYREKRAADKLKNIQQLLNDAASNGSFNELVTLKNQISKPYSPQASSVKKNLLSILKKNNRSYIPITNISKSDLNEITSALSNWDAKQGSPIF
jgi:hypothetical protein